MLAAADPANPYGAALPWPKQRGRAASRGRRAPTSSSWTARRGGARAAARAQVTALLPDEEPRAVARRRAPPRGPCAHWCEATSRPALGWAVGRGPGARREPARAVPRRGRLRPLRPRVSRPSGFQRNESRGAVLPRALRKADSCPRATPSGGRRDAQQRSREDGRLALARPRWSRVPGAGAPRATGARRRGRPRLRLVARRRGRRGATAGRRRADDRGRRGARQAPPRALRRRRGAPHPPGDAGELAPRPKARCRSPAPRRPAP